MTLGIQQDDNSTYEFPQLAASIYLTERPSVVDVAYIEEERIVPTKELQMADIKNE